jgi:hypothetical protein
MGDKKGPLGYLIVGLLGAAAGAASIIGFSKMIPQMMADCMKKMKEEGMEPPECCKGMTKTSTKKRKK